MKIAIVYTGLTSYMTDCWRDLASRAGVELRVWNEETLSYRFKGDKERLLSGLRCHWGYSENLTKEKLGQMTTEISEFAPDVIFVCGWSQRLPPFVASSGKLKSIPMVLDFDMPWEWSLRKIGARFILWNRLRRFSAAFVPGASTAKYARWLGFPKNVIFEGRNCIDTGKFHVETAHKRSDFLFLGRHVKEKGLDVLRKGYELYKSKGGAWKLTIPDFVEPADVPLLMQEHACLILPSRWEPWGVVVLEAMAAGMKTIVSDRVGARFDLPVNGVFPSGDHAALASLMLEIEGAARESPQDDRLSTLSKYSCGAWAERVLEICEKVR